MLPRVATEQADRKCLVPLMRQSDHGRVLATDSSRSSPSENGGGDLAAFSTISCGTHNHLPQKLKTELCGRMSSRLTWGAARLSWVRTWLFTISSRCPGFPSKTKLLMASGGPVAAWATLAFRRWEAKTRRLVMSQLQIAVAGVVTCRARRPGAAPRSRWARIRLRASRM